jgi:hypothetical protein
MFRGVHRPYITHLKHKVFHSKILSFQVFCAFGAIKVIADPLLEFLKHEKL